MEGFALCPRFSLHSTGTTIKPSFSAGGFRQDSVVVVVRREFHEISFWVVGPDHEVAAAVVVVVVVLIEKPTNTYSVDE